MGVESVAEIYRSQIAEYNSKAAERKSGWEKIGNTVKAAGEDALSFQECMKNALASPQVKVFLFTYLQICNACPEQDCKNVNTHANTLISFKSSIDTCEYLPHVQLLVHDYMSFMIIYADQKSEG